MATSDKTAPPGAPRAAAPPAPPVARVRATRDGFYHGQRIRPGKAFTLLDPRHFSDKWMVRCGVDEPDELAEQLARTPKRKRESDGTPRRRSQTTGDEQEATAGAAPKPGDEVI
jgi:hypothetical protein